VLAHDAGLFLSARSAHSASLAQTRASSAMSDLLGRVAVTSKTASRN
jgi:hypothetical protein